MGLAFVDSTLNMNNRSLAAFADLVPFYSLSYEKKSKKKKKKPKANNWFEKCTVEELKQLCKASLQPVSGTKSVLVDRLLGCDLTVRFGDLDFLTIPVLKSECRDKGLALSGKRYDLILRLVQNETSSETGIEPKKAVGSIVDPQTGKFVPKPRAKSMKPPDPSKLGDRMWKKCYPSDKAMDKWSNYHSKYHLSRCVTLANELLQNEVVEKELFQRGMQELAWQVVKELIRWWLYPDGASLRGCAPPVRGMGYAGLELSDLFKTLVMFIELTTEKETLSELHIDVLLRDLHSEAQAYGHGYSGSDDWMTNLESALNKYFPADEKEQENAAVNGP